MSVRRCVGPSWPMFLFFYVKKMNKEAQGGNGPSGGLLVCRIQACYPINHFLLLLFLQRLSLKTPNYDCFGWRLSEEMPRRLSRLTELNIEARIFIQSCQQIKVVRRFRNLRVGSFVDFVLVSPKTIK